MYIKLIAFCTIVLLVGLAHEAQGQCFGGRCRAPAAAFYAPAIQVPVIPMVPMVPVVPAAPAAEAAPAVSVPLAYYVPAQTYIRPAGRYVRVGLFGWRWRYVQ